MSLLALARTRLSFVHRVHGHSARDRQLRHVICVESKKADGKFFDNRFDLVSWPRHSPSAINNPADIPVRCPIVNQRRRAGRFRGATTTSRHSLDKIPYRGLCRQTRRTVVSWYDVSKGFCYAKQTCITDQHDSAASSAHGCNDKTRRRSTLSLSFLPASPGALTLVLEMPSRIPTEPVARHHELGSVQPLSFVQNQGGISLPAWSTVDVGRLRRAAKRGLAARSVYHAVPDGLVMNSSSTARLAHPGALTEPCPVSASCSITDPTNSSRHLFEQQLPHPFHF